MTIDNSSTNLNKENGKRKAMLIGATLIFVLCGIVYGLYWFMVLRHYQTTNDAYVVGNQVRVMSQVSGSVTKIYAENMDLVHKGDLLLELDPFDTKQAFERAKTDLADNVRQLHRIKADNKRLLANIELKRALLSRAQDDLKRREHLGKKGAIDKETLSHSRIAVQVAQAELDVAIHQYQANKALLLDTTIDQQPAVKQAAVRLRESWIALQRTKIVAPITGYVSRRSVQVGAQIGRDTPLMVLVAADNLWVDANFKEVQIAEMRIGQLVTMTSDVYGDDVVFDGRIVGLDMGTGSAFSLLPAQNATGNWIKVVQRLPVRIEFVQPQQVINHPLRIGLSMTVDVDLSKKDGLMLADTPRNSVIYATDTLTHNQTEIEQTINRIIQANMGESVIGIE